MTETNLYDFNFPQDDFQELRCRKCNSRIHKFGYTILLGTSVRYGWCRWYTHGISVQRTMK